MPIEAVHKGNSIDEVLRILRKYGENGKVIAGGTDIIIEMRNKKIQPNVLVDISHIEELKQIQDINGFIEIGAAVTFTEIVESSFFVDNLYGLNKASRLVGSPQIRNKGTIGGNIANGSAAADAIPPLIALDSVLIIENEDGRREVKLEDYYRDGIGIREDELLTKIRFKKPRKSQSLSFSKLGLRKALAISRISMANLMELDENGKILSVSMASGALGKYPLREVEVEEFLLGKVLDENTIGEALKVLQGAMDNRLGGRSTLPYKRVAVERMLREVMEI
jgi:CO/xanthine dehydrogenase FAD-binding subunit